MRAIKTIIPKERMEILKIIATILPTVPMIQKNEDGSYQYKSIKDGLGQDRLALADHKREIPGMYRAGGMHQVKQYVDATYGVAEAFYGENNVYGKLIAK